MRTGDEMITLRSLHDRLCVVESNVVHQSLYLDLALEVSSTGKFELNIDTKIIKLDPKSAKILGLNDLSMPFEYFLTKLLPEDVIRLKENINEAINHCNSFDCTVKTAIGTPVRCKGRVFCNDRSMPIVLYGVCTHPIERRCSSVPSTQV